MQIIDEGLITGLNETQQNLLKAKQKIEDKEHWCIGAVCCNQFGVPVPMESTAAYMWCAIGALKAVALSDLDTVTTLFAAAVELYDQEPSEVNDYMGHEAVMTMYNRAIELAARTYIWATTPATIILDIKGKPE